MQLILALSLLANVIFICRCFGRKRNKVTIEVDENGNVFATGALDGNRSLIVGGKNNSIKEGGE